jgi:hypothetical protein
MLHVAQVTLRRRKYLSLPVQAAFLLQYLTAGTLTL